MKLELVHAIHAGEHWSGAILHNPFNFPVQSVVPVVGADFLMHLVRFDTPSNWGGKNT